MAVSALQFKYDGLSSDTKPTLAIDGSALPTGSEFREVDTGAEYEWNGSAWVAKVAGTPTESVTSVGPHTDDEAFTPGTSKVFPTGMLADEAATDSVTEGDAGIPRMTLDRKVITTPQPHTAGGLSIFRSLDLDESEEEVKATPGQIYGIWVTNLFTATRFLKIYNATAANVTVGTTTPVITIAIPGNSADDVSGNFNVGGMGIAFDTAISVAATTGIADNDTGAPGANEVLINIFYK